MSLDRVRLMTNPYSTEKLVYSLYNHTCNGTEATAINTGLRLFNVTDYPYGFKLEFSGTAEINPASLPYGLGSWLGCMDETGSPWPGFVVRHDRNKQTLDMSVNAASGTILSQDKTANSGTTVNITFTYNRSIFTKIVDDVSSSASGSITHNFPLCIGGTLQTETTWFSDRFGYVKVNSLKVYKLRPVKLGGCEPCSYVSPPYLSGNWGKVDFDIKDFVVNFDTFRFKISSDNYISQQGEIELFISQELGNQNENAIVGVVATYNGRAANAALRDERGTTYQAGRDFRRSGSGMKHVEGWFTFGPTMPAVNTTEWPTNYDWYAGNASYYATNYTKLNNKGFSYARLSFRLNASTVSRFYGCVIEQNGTTIANIIPVIWNNGRYGLYDTITKNGVDHFIIESTSEDGYFSGA